MRAFDLDGLLFDTERLAAATWTEAAHVLGFDLAEETVRGTIGMDHVMTRAYYDRLFEGRFPYERVERLHSDLFRTHIVKHGAPAKPGMERILQETRRLGLRAALGTSSRAVYAHAMLWLAGIEGHFQVLVTRDQVQVGKPAPDIFLRAAGLLECEPGDCLVFEDSITGLNAAFAAGMRAIMVPDLIPPTAELRSRCLGVFPSLVEAAAALEGLIQGS